MGRIRSDRSLKRPPSQEQISIWFKVVTSSYYSGSSLPCLLSCSEPSSDPALAVAQVQYLSTCTSTDTAKIDMRGRLVAQGLVRQLCIVETKIAGQTHPQLIHPCVAVEVDVFVFYAPPQPFNKDVAQRTPPAVHADFNASLFKMPVESPRVNCAPLVCVEDLRLPMVTIGFPEAIHAEGRFECVR